MSATLSICLMISHRLPTHWPKRPWRRCRRSSAVKCPHSPLTWPQALPAPAKRWVSSMTKHEQMLRVVCHLFFFCFHHAAEKPAWKLWSHNLQQCSATWFLLILLTWTADLQVQFSAPDHHFATHLYSEQLEVWHQVCGPFYTDLPSDCNELYNRGARVSGIYAIRPNGAVPFMAFCDMSKGTVSLTLELQRSTGQQSIF